MKKFLFGLFFGFVLGILTTLNLLLKNKSIQNGLADAIEEKIRKWVYGPSGQPSYRTYGNPKAKNRIHYFRKGLVLSNKEEAELVLERMNDILIEFGVVSVMDLKELMGLPIDHVDQKWGWLDLPEAHIRQIREGYTLDLPEPSIVA